MPLPESALEQECHIYGYATGELLPLLFHQIIIFSKQLGECLDIVSYDSRSIHQISSILALINPTIALECL